MAINIYYYTVIAVFWSVARHESPPAQQRFVSLDRRELHAVATYTNLVSKDVACERGRAESKGQKTCSNQLPLPKAFCPDFRLAWNADAPYLKPADL